MWSNIDNCYTARIDVSLLYSCSTCTNIDSKWNAIGFDPLIQQGIIMGQKNTYVVISILCIVPSIVSDILVHTSHSGQFSTQHIGG